MGNGTGPRGDRPVVYDTDQGRLCPTCQRPINACICRLRGAVPKRDGIVRVSRDKRNRRGKTVTVITGVPADPGSLEVLAATLKRLCGSGGTAKDGTIEIQGDHRDLVLSKLTEMGYRAKLAGG